MIHFTCIVLHFIPLTSCCFDKYKKEQDVFFLLDFQPTATCCKQNRFTIFSRLLYNISVFSLADILTCQNRKSSGVISNCNNINTGSIRFRYIQFRSVDKKVSQKVWKPVMHRKNSIDFYPLTCHIRSE